MSSQALAKAVRKRYIDVVLCAQNVPTQFDNQDEDDQFTKPSDSIWARCSIFTASSTQVDICETPRIRTLGTIIFNVFVPVGKGDKEAREFADIIKSKFRLVTVDDVLYRVPTISPVGRDKTWWQVNVTCPYQFDEIVSLGE